MKKLSEDKIKEILTFLEANKGLVGMSGWSILVKEEIGGGDHHASIEVDVYEQVASLEVTNRFMELDESRQQSVLLHELIHGRIEVYKKIVEELTAYEEERLANDLERGMYSLFTISTEDNNS